jgi:membrane protein required for colicin V production
MNYFDVSILIIISFGLLRGFIKGFVLEVSSLIALYFGIISSLNFSDVLFSYISNYINWDDKTLKLLCFFVIFITVVYGVSIIAKIITKVLKIASLGLLNRIFGSLFGGLKWLIILCGVLAIYDSANQIITIVPSSLIEESKTYQALLNLGTFMFDWATQKNMGIKNTIL